MLHPNPRALLFAALLAWPAVVAGCGAGPDTGGDPAQSFLLELSIAAGVDIDEVAWRVSGGDMEDMMGTVDTSAPQSTASIELFGIPEGSGYLLRMEALSAAGDFFCEGSSTFDVAIGVATPVDITLNCKRECGVVICGEPDTDCELILLPDGTRCANGAGSCVAGACEIPGA